MLPAPLRLPRYDEACLTHLLDDVAAAVRRRGPRLLPLPEDLRGVVVLVVDGLGRRLLDAHRDVAPFLAAAPGPTVDAVFPTTTSTNLTSLATGLTPRQHGIAGTVLQVGGRRFVTLTWTWERLVGGEDARAEVPPSVQQPLPTGFQRMAAVGIRPVTVLRHDHVGSGFTTASLRGGEIRSSTGEIGDTLTTAVAEATATATPTVVYCHHAEVDTAGHLQGPGSARWCAELAAVDHAVERVAADLPNDVALVVTADHGQVLVDDAAVVELVDHPELLEGVRVVAGDPRAPQLHVVDGALDDVIATWRERCGDHAVVHTRTEALTDGWLGPVPPAAEGDEASSNAPLDHASRPAQIGDVVVAARGPIAWAHRELDHRGGRMPGYHASLTPEELEVPALVVTR